MGTVILVRHGEAEGNSHHRLIGWSDVALTERGQEQARLVAERLGGIDVKRVVASDLQRTLQTAQPIAAALGHAIETDTRLREIDNGDWTGLEPQQIEKDWPGIWHRYTHGEDVDRPNGERWSDVRNRVIESVIDHLQLDGMTVLVSHGGPLLITAAWASGVPLPGNIFRGSFGPADNTSLCTVTDGPRLIGYNDVGHLDGLARIDVPYTTVTRDV